MAIRINLIPGSVNLQRRFQQGIVASVLLVSLVAGGLFLLYHLHQQKLNKYTEDAAAIDTYALRAEAAQNATQTLQGETQPMQTAVNFMSDASKTGAERAALLDLIRSYIYYAPRGGAIVQSMDISDGQTVKLNATVRTPDDYSRFLQKLRQGSVDKSGPLFDGLPVASGIGGFPPPLVGKNGTPTNTAPTGAPGQASPGQGSQIAPGENIMVLPNAVTAVGKLKHPIVLPPDPVGGAPATGAGGSSSSSSSGRPGYP